MNKKTKRNFSTGSIRDVSLGKIDYYGIRNPLLEQYFGKYMMEHTKMPDGSIRSTNNWWLGWDTIVSLQSLVRHVEDLQAIHAGFDVVELRHKDGRVEKKYINKDDSCGDFDCDIKTITVEECCSAIRFNAMAYLLEYLKNK